MKFAIFQLPKNQKLKTQKLKLLLGEISANLDFGSGHCQIIFISDKDLADLHGKFLNDPSETDVITFDISDNETEIDAEIYISVDRAKRQAAEYGVGFENELLRLMIHGLLHLKGYDDRTESDFSLMKEAENRLVEEFARAID